MARQIFLVSAQIVQSNGVLAILEGYPKSFDSKNYNDDIDKTKRRAESDLSDVWSDMLKRDDRLISTVKLDTVDGFNLITQSYGSFPADPEPNQA